MSKAKGHPDDISIGSDEWIHFVDITGRTANAANIDPLIQPMEAFWRKLEMNCVTECCGINAHSFWAKDIWNAVRNCQDSDLKQKLADLRKHVDSLSVECVCSDILNEHLDRTLFSKLLDHIIATVNRM